MGYLHSLKLIPHKIFYYKADTTLIKLVSPVTGWSHLPPGGMRWEHGITSLTIPLKMHNLYLIMTKPLTNSDGGTFYKNKWSIILKSGLSWWLSGKESACQCRRQRDGFDPWVGKIPWRRKWQPTPVFLLGKSKGQRSLAGYSWRHRSPWSQTWLSTHDNES